MGLSDLEPDKQRKYDELKKKYQNKPTSLIPKKQPEPEEISESSETEEEEEIIYKKKPKPKKKKVKKVQKVVYVSDDSSDTDDEEFIQQIQRKKEIPRPKTPPQQPLYKHPTSMSQFYNFV